jgi:hypothetical protein
VETTRLYACEYLSFIFSLLCVFGLRQPVSSEQAGYKDSYYKQYRQPTYSKPPIAENDSYYGQISKNTGRPKTVYVRGYRLCGNQTKLSFFSTY